MYVIEISNYVEDKIAEEMFYKLGYSQIWVEHLDSSTLIGFGEKDHELVTKKFETITPPDVKRVKLDAFTNAQIKKVLEES